MAGAVLWGPPTSWMLPRSSASACPELTSSCFLLLDSLSSWMTPLETRLPKMKTWVTPMTSCPSLPTCSPSPLLESLPSGQQSNPARFLCPSHHEARLAPARTSTAASKLVPLLALLLPAVLSPCLAGDLSLKGQADHAPPG